MSIGLGDLKILLGQFLSTNEAVTFSDQVVGQTPFAEFKALQTGSCRIMIGCDTSGIHLSMADLTLDGVFRGVDSGRYLMVGDWNLLEGSVVAGHDYAFETNGDADVAIIVTITPVTA